MLFGDGFGLTLAGIKKDNKISKDKIANLEQKINGMNEFFLDKLLSEKFPTEKEAKEHFRNNVSRMAENGMLEKKMLEEPTFLEKFMRFFSTSERERITSISK